MSRLNRNQIEYEEDLDERVVTIPVERRSTVVLMALICVFIGAPAGVWNAQDLVKGTENAHSLACLDIAAAMIAVLLGCLVLAWATMGRQVITRSAAALEIRNRILGFAFTREFQRSRIRNLRIVKPRSLTLFPLDSHGPLLSRGQVGLAFEYEGSTVYFGQYLDEPEARSIMEYIQ